MRRFHSIIRDSGIRPGRALEVGGWAGDNSLLNVQELRDAERFCINLQDVPSGNGIVAVTGNANSMRMFADDSFDLVMSNATLEHDRCFWLSVAEMKRVLKPDGLLIIGVPGFVESSKPPAKRATLTYKVHHKVDYYRFSEQAVREVFFDGMEDVEVAAMLTPPRLIGHGRKPGIEAFASLQRGRRDAS